MDLAITIDGTTKQFNLAQDQGRKLFQVSETIPTQSIAGAERSLYTSLPPELSCSFEQSNWEGGLGQLDWENPSMYCLGGNIDTRLNGRLMLGPKIYVPGSSLGTAAYPRELWFSKDGASVYLYCTDMHNGKIYKSNGGEVWTTVYTATTGESMRGPVVRYGTWLVAPLYNGYIYSTTGDLGSWTKVTVSGELAERFTVTTPQSGTQMLLVRAYETMGRGYISTGIDPTSSTLWTLGYEVEEVVNYADPISFNGQLYVATDNAVWSLPADGQVTKILSLSAQNGCVVVFQARLILGDGTRVIQVSSYNTIEDISPNMYLAVPPTSGDELGNPYFWNGVCASDRELFVSVTMTVATGSTGHYLLCGIPTDSGWAWHPVIEQIVTTAYGYGSLAHPFSCQNAIYFYYAADTDNFYIGRAMLTPNNLWSTGLKFAPSGYIVTSWFDGGYPTWEKVFYQLHVDTKGCTATRTIKFYYQTEDMADFSASAMATITSDGIQRLNIATPIQAKRVRLKIELATDSETATPQLMYSCLKGVLQPELTKLIDFTVVLEDTSSRTPSVDLTFLRGGRTSASLVKIYDNRFKSTRYCTFMPGSPQEVEMVDEKGRQPALAARINAQETTWSP